MMKILKVAGVILYPLWLCLVALAWVAFMTLYCVYGVIKGLVLFPFAIGSLIWALFHGRGSTANRVDHWEGGDDGDA